MAHQYITVENQTLLWKTINRSPQLANNTIAINREQWFSNIIKQFYEKINTPSLSIAGLKALNQQTIAHMVGDLKRIESQYSTPSVSYDNQLSTTNSQTSNLNGPSISSPYGISNGETPQTRMSMYADQFNARQQEYTNMVNPPTPPIANFTEKVEEEPITNMDELLQQQIKQREYDIAQARPPPLPTLPPTYPKQNEGNTTARPSSPMSPNKNNISATTTNLWEESEVTQTPTQTPEAKRRSLEAMNAIIQELQKQLADLREEVAKISRHNGQDIVYIKQPIIPTIQLDRTADVEDAI